MYVSQKYDIAEIVLCRNIKELKRLVITKKQNLHTIKMSFIFSISQLQKKL